MWWRVRGADRIAFVATDLFYAQERLRILEAMVCALDEPHVVLDLVLAAQDPDEANAALRQRFGLDQVQAMAIVDIQYRRLTQPDRQRIRDDLREVRSRVESLGG